jgi:hypothetical protein
MTNLDFLICIKNSFIKFLETGSRSNQKLKILHGQIAHDISNRLGNKYEIKSLGFGEDKESKIQGRYINKNVDITILKNNVVVAGIGVKFVMQNYSQNSNNYFENMLGETANIRSNNIPYFQVFIIPEIMPYFENSGNIKQWETFTSHNIHKYKVLSEDFVETSIHTPTKTLFYLIKLPKIKGTVSNKKDYLNYYNKLNSFQIETSKINYGTFSSNVIYNDYEDFINKLIYRIKSI